MTNEVINAAGGLLVLIASIFLLGFLILGGISLVVNKRVKRKLLKRRKAAEIRERQHHVQKVAEDWKPSGFTADHLRQIEAMQNMGILSENEVRTALNIKNNHPLAIDDLLNSLSKPDTPHPCPNCGHSLDIHTNWCEKEGCTCLKI